jgi:hypothetical protein
LNFKNNPRHLFPKSASFPVKPSPFTGNRDVLAREAARNHVNNSAPRLSVKGANIIPNRERRENPVILSLCKNACGVGFPLDGAHCPPSENFPAPNASTSARE